MISVRRLIASLLAGALLVLASAAQASAQPAPDLDRAFEGVALGFAAASELAGDGDVIVVGEGVIKALEVLEAWDAKFAESNRQGVGEGPANAIAVHDALIAGDIPGHLVKESGSKISELDGVYELLKGKSEEAQAAKDAKEKSNNGKSEGKAQNDKSQSDKNSSESAKGQQNRP